MKTVSRTHKARIARVFASATDAVVHAESNGFAAQAVEIEHVRSVFEGNDKTRMSVGKDHHGRHRAAVHVHAGLWYYLHLPAGFELD